MRINPKTHGEQINTLIQVWTALNPTRSYNGLSLSDLRKDLQPSLDVRTRIAAAQAELTVAMRERDAVDQVTLKLYKRALSLIKADSYGEKDGQMLKAVLAGTRRARRSGVLHSGTTPSAELTAIKPAA